MKKVVDIKDGKASFFMRLLEHFKFINSVKELKDDYGLSDEEKAAIDEALIASEKGEIYTSEEVNNMIKNKFPNL